MMTDVRYPHETREEQISRWERAGELDPGCAGCKEFYAAEAPSQVFAPGHKAKKKCESGGRPHCTCDACF